MSSLIRIPVYILLIVCLQINSHQWHWRSCNVLTLAAPFTLTSQEDDDYAISNEDAFIADDNGALEELLKLNLPQMNVELKADDTGMDYNFNQGSISQHSFMDGTPLNGRTKLNTILSLDEGGNGNGIANTNTLSNVCPTDGGGAPNAKPPIDRKELEEQQEIIDHVTSLIRSMREHAIGIIKDMNDLEMDFLYSTGAGSGNDANKNCNDAVGGSSNAFNSDIPNLTTSPNNGMCNDNSAATTPSPSTGNKWNNSNNNNNNNCKSINFLNGISNEKKFNTPNYVVNEWSAPVATNDNPAIDAKQFMQQAHEAVKSWREQIEACKQILDAAVTQAGHTHHSTNNMQSDMDVARTTNNISTNRNGDTETVTTSASSASSVPLSSPSNDAAKMKKQIISTQNNDNTIARNYDDLINTLRGRVPNVWNLPT